MAANAGRRRARQAGDAVRERIDGWSAWAVMGRPLSWMSIALDGWAMGIEASAVIGLRMVKLAGGGAKAAAEAELMVAEKIAAAIELQALAVTGALGTSLQSATARSIRHYAPKVRANRRRLRR